MGEWGMIVNEDDRESKKQPLDIFVAFEDRLAFKPLRS